MTLHASVLRQSPLDSLHPPAYRSRSGSALSLLPHVCFFLARSPIAILITLYTSNENLTVLVRSFRLLSLWRSSSLNSKCVHYSHTFALFCSFVCFLLFHHFIRLLLSLLNRSHFFYLPCVLTAQDFSFINYGKRNHRCTLNLRCTTRLHLYLSCIWKSLK